MTEKEYLFEKERILESVRFNDRIKCYRVAARCRRELDALEREWEEEREKRGG